jgi:hypothetical protein
MIWMAKMISLMPSTAVARTAAGWLIIGHSSFRNVEKEESSDVWQTLATLR